MKACRQLRELDTAVALLEHHLNFQRPELICINAFLSVCSEVRLTTSQAHKLTAATSQAFHRCKRHTRSPSSIDQQVKRQHAPSSLAVLATKRMNESRRRKPYHNSYRATTLS